jgi:hypothetical protein
LNPGKQVLYFGRLPDININFLTGKFIVSCNDRRGYCF